MLNPENSFPEGLGVERLAVADAAEVGNRHLIAPVPHGNYTRAGYQVAGRNVEAEAEATEGKGNKWWDSKHCFEKKKMEQKWGFDFGENYNGERVEKEKDYKWSVLKV
ncbi:hypothetical protein GQ457_04G037510 [Hibiscus cannabinus]